MLEDFKQAFQRPNNAHIRLIIINVVVFVVFGIAMVFLNVSGAESIYISISNSFSLPSRFQEFLQQPWSIITYAFMHGGVIHILMNMLVFYWFGRLFVEYLGSDKLIAVYVLGALFGGLFYLIAYNAIPYFVSESEQVRVTMVGASAAVNAVVVAAATLLPDYTFFLLLIGPVRIKYIAAVLVFLSFIGVVGSNAGGNIAHLGGALIGFVYIKQLQQGVNWGAWVTAFIYWIKDLFKSKPKVKVTYRSEEKAQARGKGKSKVSQEEIDAILDKISAGGYESLTREEKEKLFNASKKS